MSHYPQSCRYFYLHVTSNPVLSIKVHVEGFLLAGQDCKQQKAAAQHQLINYLFLCKVFAIGFAASVALGEGCF